MFDPITKLLLGLATGFVFGFLLQKGRVAKYDVIVGQFLGRDFTVVKIMGSAVVVGAIGIYAMLPAGVVTLHLKSLNWAGILGGGALFGIGMAILGYCPGTGVAACGEGRRDAVFGFLGMMIGAAIYVALFPQFKSFAGCLGSAGKVTLPELTHTSPWIWISALAIGGGVAAFLGKRDAKQTPSQT